MPLMSPNRIEALRSAIGARAARFIATDPFTLTPEEFVEAFIRPEHLESLNQVRDIVGDIGSSYTSTAIPVQIDDQHADLTFGIHFEGSQAPVLLPRYISSGPRRDCPEPLLRKIKDKATARYKTGSVFGDAIDAIYWLNNNAGDLRAMRTLFPALPVLLADINDDPKAASNKMARKLDANKTITSLPRLPREVMRKMIEASHMITATTLLPTNVTTSHPIRTAVLALSGIKPTIKRHVADPDMVGAFV